jgi:hypothetical protein
MKPYTFPYPYSSPPFNANAAMMNTRDMGN